MSCGAELLQRTNTSEYLLDALFKTRRRSFKQEFRRDRFFIRLLHTREVLQLPCARATIETLGIALLRNLERHCNMHFDKRNAA